MNWKLTLKLLLAFLIGSNVVSAQLSCEYFLLLEDSWGDGWNGAVLTITVNGESTDYTVNFNDNNGDYAEFFLSLQSGDEVTLDYAPGSFENEVTYTLFNADGVAIWTDGPNPQIGANVYSFIAECPPCPIPPTGGVSIDDIRAFRASISWVPSDPDGEYVVEYGTSGFVPESGDGTVLMLNGSNTTLGNLEENTEYDFYLSVICANGDTSSLIGPYQFMTPWANDVGIVEVLDPLTGCGLSSAETVRVMMSNFGGNPQSLIPFNYSVNGIPSGVAMPFDGLYTGVLGVDSTELVIFDTPFDFSEPGVYTIDVWTDLMADSVRMNDTTTITITSIPVITEFPYFEDFEEWNGDWTVGEGGTLPTWEHGTPDAPIINSAASGNNAWVTNLTDVYGSSEFSYLESPCFDFSGMTEDPIFGVSLFLSMETFDYLRVEVTGDDGETWNSLGAVGEGINWYNSEFNQSWSGANAIAGDWSTAFYRMEGFADSSDIRLRFVFDGSFFPDMEGVGIDDVFITQPFEDDLGALRVDNSAADGCGAAEDQVTMTIVNLGEMSQLAFEVAYQVNDGTPVIENVGPLTVPPFGTANYTFATPFNSSDGEEFVIKAWTIFDDPFAQNDTTTKIVSVEVFQLPIMEDFESNVFPANWNSDEGFPLYGAGVHNTPTINIADNLYSGDQQFIVELPFVGPIGDPLFISFDYRYTNWSAGTVPAILGPNDKLEVQISTNCTDYETIYTIDQTNHIDSADFATITLETSDYVGENIKLRLLGTWGSGDYWLDIDNINMATCAGFASEIDITDESTPGAADGSILIIPVTGVAPYDFEWSDGGDGAIRTDLPAGTYQVVITDANGCVETVEVVVDVLVGVGEIELLEAWKLMPNPTTGNAVLELQLREQADVNIQVLNMVGQLIYQQSEQNVTNARYTIDLNNVPDGMYLVQLMVKDQVLTNKLVKAQQALLC